MKNWMTYSWILTGNVLLFGIIARLFTFKLVTNDWGDIIWLISGVVSMKCAEFFYKKTI